MILVTSNLRLCYLGVIKNCLQLVCCKSIKMKQLIDSEPQIAAEIELLSGKIELQNIRI